MDNNKVDLTIPGESLTPNKDQPWLDKDYIDRINGTNKEQYVSPDYKHGSSANIDVGNTGYGDSKYDKGATIKDLLYGGNSYVNSNRGENQSWLTKAAYITPKGLGGIWTTIEDMSYIYLWPQKTAALITDMETYNSTIVGEWARQNREALNEYTLPIYGTSDKVMDAGSFGHWANMLSGVLDSAVGFGIPGGIVTKGVSTIQKVARASKVLTEFADVTKIANKVSQTTGRIINATASGLVMNFMEGQFMSVDTYHNVMAELQPMIDAGEIEQKDAEEIAGRAGDRMARWNTTMLASNILQSYGLYTGKGATRNIIKPGGLKGIAAGFTEMSADNLAIQMTQEGAEEMGQNAIQYEQQYQALKEAGADISKYSPDFYKRVLNYLKDDETILQGIMGFISGPIQRGLTKTVTGGYGKKARTDYLNLQKLQSETFAENEEFIKSNLEEIYSLQENLSRAATTGDAASEQVLKSWQFYKLAMKNFEAGTTGQLEGILKNIIKTVSSEDAKANGWSENYKNAAAIHLGVLADLENKYTKYTKYENQSEVFGNDLTSELIGTTKVGLIDTHGEVVGSLVDKINELTKIHAPSLVGKIDYETNSRGIKVPVLRDSNYVKEGDASLQELKRLRDSVENNIDIEENLKHQENILTRIDITNDKLESLSKERKVITSAKYQDAVIKANKELKSAAKEIAKEVKKQANSNQSKANKSRAEANKIKVAKTAEKKPDVKPPVDSDEASMVEDDNIFTEKELSEGAKKPEVVAPVEKKIVPEAKVPVIDEIPDLDGVRPEGMSGQEWDFINRIAEEYAKNPRYKPTPSVAKQIVKFNSANAKPGAFQKLVDRRREELDKLPVTKEEKIEATSSDTASKAQEGKSYSSETDSRLSGDTEVLTEVVAADNGAVVGLDEDGAPVYDNYKVRTGANKFAMLSRAYNIIRNKLSNALQLKDATDELTSDEVNRRILNYKKYKAGTAIRLVVEDDDNITITVPATIGSENQVTTTWGEYKASILKSNPGVPIEEVIEYIQTIPVAIYDKDGKKIGYVHQTMWINESRTTAIDGSGEQREDRDNNIKLRRQAISAGKNGIKTKIISRSTGYLFKTGILKPVKTNMPDKKIIFGTASGNEIYTDRKNTFNPDITLLNKQYLRDGATYAIVQVSEDKHIAIPLRQTIVNKNSQKYIANSIKMALAISKGDKEYQDSPLNNKFITAIYNETGYNITDPLGLTKYLSLMMVNYNLGEANDLEDFFNNGLGQDIKSDRFIVSFKNGAIYFGTRAENYFIPKGQSLNDGTRLAINKFIGYVSGEDPDIDIYFNTSLEHLNSNKNVPIYNDEEGTIDTISYKDMVRENTATNIVGTNIGTEEEPFYTYTVNPVIYFDSEFAAKSDTSTEESGSETSLVDNAMKDIKPVPASMLFGDVKEAEKPSDDEILNKYNIDDDNLDALPAPTEGETTDVATQTDKHFVKGLTANQQNELINYLVYKIVDEIYRRSDDSEPLAKDVVFRKQLNEFINDKNYLSNKLAEDKFNEKDKERVQKVIDTLDTIINGWGTVQILTLDALDTIDGIKIKRNEDTDDVTDEGEAQIKENANWDSVSAFTIDSKNTASKELRRFLSGIRTVYTPKTNSPYEAKQVKSKMTFFGKPKIMSFDEVYDSLHRMLANSGKGRSVETYIDKLKALALEHPYLYEVVKRLDSEASSQLRNQFFVDMTKHYVDMRFYMVKQNDDGSYGLTEYEDNANSIQRSILAAWKTNMSTSAIVIPSITNADDLVFDPDVKANMMKKFAELLRKAKSGGMTDKDYAVAREWILQFGIKLSDEGWKALIDGKFMYRNKALSFKELFTSQGGIFRVLNRIMQSKAGEAVNIKGPMEDGIVKRLATFDGLRSKMLYSNTHTSNGKIIYSFSNNKYFIDRFLQLRDDVNKLTQLAKLPFTKDSAWLKQLLVLDENGDIKFNEETGLAAINKEGDFYHNFGYWIASLEPLKNKFVPRDGRELDKLTDKEHEIIKIGTIQSVRPDGAISIIYPTNSDKTVAMALTVMAMNIKFNIDATITDDSLGELFDAAVQPEIERIRNFQVTNGSQTVFAGYEKGAGRFWMLPGMNNIEGLFDEDGKLNEAIYYPASKEGAELKANMLAVLRNYVDTLVNDKLSKWREYGIGETNVSNNTKNRYLNDSYMKWLQTNDKIKEAATQMVVQYLFANANIMQLFIGDPAIFYKSRTDKTLIEQVEETYTNIGKRLAGDIAPGETIFTEEDGNVVYAFIEDPIYSSKNLEQLRERLGSKADAYLNKGVTPADGQEFTTVKEHATVLYKNGRITKKMYEGILHKVNKHGPGGYYNLNIEETNAIMQPIKPVYVNNVVDEKEGIEMRYYVKSSSFPLIPELVAGLELDNLRHAMEKSGTDRLAFNSAVKVGQFKDKHKVFHEGTDTLIGGVDEVADVLRSARRSLPRTGFKIQQDVPFKEKQKINRVTQASKNIFTNILGIAKKDGFMYHGEKLSGRELHKQYNDSYKKLFEVFQNTVQTEIDYNPTTKEYNKEKLKNLLQAEAMRRGWPLSERLAFEHKDFFSTIPFSPFADRYEALMCSIINNKIVKSKMPGISSVLGTEAGFKLLTEDNADAKRDQLTNGRSKVVFTDSFDAKTGLKPAYTDDKGVFHPAQAIVPWKFYDKNGKLIRIKKFMKDGKLDLSKIDPELLTIVGMRIPSQGLNSSSAIEIVGFTPEEAGDLFIATSDFVAQMGSDFDIDKIYSYMTPSVIDEDEEGNIKLIPVSKKYSLEEYSNKFIEARKKYFHMLSSYNNVLYDEDMDAETKSNMKTVLSEAKKELSSILDIYTKLIQSDIIDVHKSIFTTNNKDVQTLISEPLGEWELGKLANELDSFKKEKRANAEDVGNLTLLSDEYQKGKYINATAGKSGVAKTSIDNVFNSLCQAAGDLVMMTDKEDDEALVVKFGNKISNGELSDEKTLSGKTYKSIVITGYQSASVDNEKLQILGKLNINDYTFNVIKLLNQLGFEEEVIYFINQEIIKDFIHEFGKIKGTFDEYTPGQRQEAINRVLSSKKYATENYSDTDRYHADAGSDMLRDMIRHGEAGVALYGMSIEEYRNTQKKILEKFIELSDKGTELSFVQSTINIDAAGIGQSILEAQVKQENIDTILSGKTNVLNAERLLGVVVMANDEKVYEPTTINGFASHYGLGMANDIFTPIFRYGDNAVMNLFHEIEKVTSKGSMQTSGRADFRRAIWDSMRSYLYASSNVFKLPDGVSVSDARKQLMFDTYVATIRHDPDYDRTVSAYEFSSKDSNMSIASIVNVLQQHRFGKDNDLLRRLLPMIAVKPSFREGDKAGTIRQSYKHSFLKFNASARERFDDMTIYSAILDMIVNDKPIMLDNGKQFEANGQLYTTAMLANELIVSSYLSGGKQEAVQFLKYIPPSYLHAIGFFKAISSVNTNNNAVTGYDPFKPDTASIMAEQYIQHNPNIAPRLNNFTKQTVNRNANELVKLEKFVFGKVIVGEDKKKTIKLDRSMNIDVNVVGVGWVSVQPFYLAINAPTGYKLFKRVGNEYHKIDTLGSFGMSEYQYLKRNATSNLIANKVDKTTPNVVIADVNIPSVVKVSKPEERVIEIPTSVSAANNIHGVVESKDAKESKGIIKGVLANIAAKTTNPFFSMLANNFVNNIDLIIQDEINGSKLNIAITQDLRASARFGTHNNTLEFSANLLANDDIENFGRVFLHEIVHTITSEKIKLLSNTEEFKKLKPEQKAALIGIKKVWIEYKNSFTGPASTTRQNAEYTIFSEKYSKAIKPFTDGKISLEEALKIAKEVEEANIVKFKIKDADNASYRTTRDTLNGVNALYSDEMLYLYPTVNLDEFVAGAMTSSKFQEKLASTHRDNTNEDPFAVVFDDKKTDTRWNRLLTAITDLLKSFGVIPEKTNLLFDAVRETMNLIHYGNPSSNISNFEIGGVVSNDAPPPIMDVPADVSSKGKSYKKNAPPPITEVPDDVSYINNKNEMFPDFDDISDVSSLQNMNGFETNCK